MRITGKLLAVEDNSGTFTPAGESREVPWSNTTVRIFDGREVVVIKAKHDGQDQARMLRPLIDREVTVEVDSPRSLDTRSVKLISDASGVASDSLNEYATN